jgi:hypothetical protein
MTFIQMKKLLEFYEKKNLVQDRLLKMCDENFFCNEDVSLVRTILGFEVRNTLTQKIITFIDESFIDNLLETQIIIKNGQEEKQI